MAHLLISWGKYDTNFVANGAADLDAYKERVDRYPPSVAAELTGVPAEKIIEAEAYADGPSVFVPGQESCV